MRSIYPILLVVAIALTAAFAQQPQDVETVKIDTDLVTVPLIATDRNGTYVTDLKKEEFTITEDGVAQEIAFFGKVAAPFHIVLMLDTSSSTKDKLKEIQQAAFAFVQQLQPVDRVKVISFDDNVKDHNEFTSDREVLRSAIYGTRSGDGTKVYDAMDLAMNALQKIRGRKAIVLFSDGMDWHSDRATLEGNVRFLDEEGVVVYPIRFDTRATTEKLAREQAGEITPQLPTIDVVRRPSPDGTTFPGDPVPSGTPRNTGPLGLPTAGEIMRRRRDQERNRYPNPGEPAPTGNPGEIPPDPNDRNIRVPTIPDSQPRTTTTRPTSAPKDSISGVLDHAYSVADSYLKTLAEKSGGRLLRADTLKSLPDAFAQIAAELRTQYLLGYYPLNKERDEHYRTIAVATARKNVVIRARPGYLATAAR